VDAHTTVHRIVPPSLGFDHRAVPANLEAPSS
jgi:hypothetical protein